MPAPIRACIFDAYGTLLDLNSAIAGKTSSLGEKASALSALWRQRQLEYSWTRSLMKQYADFWKITEEALDFALESFGLKNDHELKKSLLQAYLELSAFSDAADTLHKLKTNGFTTAVLSNGTSAMLQKVLTANHLLESLDQCLSVEDLRTYKPDPRVYQLVCDQLNLTPQQICFVSSNPWDLAGAASFGFNAVWINRKNFPREYNHVALYAQLSSLSEIPDLLSPQL